jgi:CTP:phosphocholine cytidylyltransferase-like protein
MKSTLNFVSDIDRKTTLTIEKLLNFQRELYLHPMYEEEMQYVKEYCKEHNIDVNFLQKDFLRELYINDPDAYAENLHSYIL